jgi:hypothetical protein
MRSSKHRLTRRGLFTVGGGLAAAGAVGGSIAALGGGGADAAQNGHGAGGRYGAARGSARPKAGGAGATPSATPTASAATALARGTGHGKPMEQTVISATARGRLRPVWEILHNHCARRRRLSTPYITAMAEKVRAEGGGGDYGPNSGGYDQLGFGTLLYSK